MPVSELHAPVLSTQSESTFTYAKVAAAEKPKSHLDLAGSASEVEAICKYYSLDELSDFLGQLTAEGSLKYKRVTLQFPDELISDSATVVHELQQRLKLAPGPDSAEKSAAAPSEPCGGKSLEPKACDGEPCGSRTCGAQSENLASQEQRIWILADTSYSACCIDEVAALHVNADLVVHMGETCLNPVGSLASCYVLGKPHLDLGDLATQFRTRYPLDDFKDSSIVLMADAPHTYLLKELRHLLHEYHIVTSDLVLADSNSTIIGYTPKQHDGASLRTLGRVFDGVSLDGGDDSALSEYDLFHIGQPEPPRLLQLTTKFQSVTTFHGGKVSQGPFPNLMRRYRYMHMARAAGTVGILVNTLSLANTKKLVNEVASKIKDAGKKHYIFVVGKPNVAKLANFEAVDIWCVLGCDHQGIILDQTNEYFKPIITPYELLLAIGDEFGWTGKWVTDFKLILSEMQGEDEAVEKEEESLDNCESDEEPDFDPVTGRYVSSARPLRRLQHLQISLQESAEPSTALVQKMSGDIALRGTVSTSAAHLQSREWTGLGSDWQEGEDEEGAEVEEGTSGIARGYAFDTTNSGR